VEVWKIDPPGILDDIYYSVVPRVHFTGLKPPGSSANRNSIHRIVFEKCEKQNEKAYVSFS